MKVPFLDLKAQYQAIKPQMQQRINTVLDHCQFVMGPEIAEVEKRLAEFVGNGIHCISCGSGTDGLQLSLKALNLKPGDEVITTAFSFFATVDSIVNVGAQPVFVDIDSKTFNLDVTKLEAAITKKTKVIMPVSLYGQVSDMDEINKIAEKHKLFVIEDAAQSFGATYKNKRSCSLTTLAATSFFPAKPLGCYGDGGAVFTHDAELANIVSQLRVHGQDRRYHHIRIGTNARMDTMQAAILLAKMDRYDWELQQRQKIADRYTKAFNDANLSQLIAPFIKSDRTCAWAQYSLKVQKRDDFQKNLNELGVPTAVHYPIPMSEQPAIQPFVNQKPNTPVASAMSQQVVSLPIFPDMTDEMVNHVIEATIKVSKNL